MRRLIAAVTVVIFVAAGLSAGEMENPYKKAKIGDWATYNTVTVMAGMDQKQTSTLKQTVKAKDEKEVTLEVENQVMGRKMVSETKISLVQPYNPAQTGLKDAKVEKLGEGKETITVGGKQYDCKWIKVKMTRQQGPTSISGTSKVWICADVPLGGMVKSEGDMSIKIDANNTMKTQVTVLLKECGRAP